MTNNWCPGGVFINIIEFATQISVSCEKAQYDRKGRSSLRSAIAPHTAAYRCAVHIQAFFHAPLAMIKNQKHYFSLPK